MGLLCGRLAPLPSVQVQSQNRCIVMTALGTYWWRPRKWTPINVVSCGYCVVCPRLIWDTLCFPLAAGGRNCTQSLQTIVGSSAAHTQNNVYYSPLTLFLSVTLVHLCVSHMHTHHVRLSYCYLFLCTVLLFDTDKWKVQVSGVEQCNDSTKQCHQAKLWPSVFYLCSINVTFLLHTLTCSHYSPFTCAHIVTTSHAFTQRWNACCEEDGCMMKITGVDWYYHLCSHGILTKL